MIIERRLLSVILAGLAVLGPLAPNADAQELPPVPPLPEELEPVLEPVLGGLSPTIWTACDGAGLTVTLLLILGVPIEATAPADPVFGLCSITPLPPPAPDCAADENVPNLGALGRPISPGAVLVTQADALDALLTQTLGQMNGVLGPPLAAALGCAPAPVDNSGPPPEGQLPPLDAPPTSAAPTPPSEPAAAPGTSPMTPLPAVGGTPEFGAPAAGAAARAPGGGPGLPAGTSSSIGEGWTLWRLLLVAIALALGAYGLPRVSFPNGRFLLRR